MHGWYEAEDECNVFKVRPVVNIELKMSEKWELSMILGTFIHEMKKQGHTCGLELATSLRRQLSEDPNPNEAFQRKEAAKLRKELAELKK